MKLTEKQTTAIQLIGTLIIVSIVVYALTFGNVSNLSTIGY